MARNFDEYEEDGSQLVETLREALGTLHELEDYAAGVKRRYRLLEAWWPDMDNEASICAGHTICEV